MKPVPNIVYDGHDQQKLVTPHIRDRPSGEHPSMCLWHRRING